MTGPSLLHGIERLLPGAAVVTASSLDRAPNGPGAYTLVLRLGSPVPFKRGRDRHILSPGWYVYSGSARGPGGIRARLRRHFRRDKSIHWHVDQLTTVAEQITALAIENGSECEIVDRLIRSKLFTPAVRGFGSSDCSRCTAHLLTCG